MYKFIEELVGRYPNLLSIKEDIIKAYEIIKETYLNDGTLLIAGNGGSAADSEHIVGELMKSFCKKRKLKDDETKKFIEVDEEIGKKLESSLQGSLKAIAITGHAALSTAFANDVDPDFIFAQQIYGYGRKNDSFLAISTSGNSKNLINAVVVAKAKGLKVIALTGKDGGELKKYADISIIAPENETFKIQELHLPIYHALCLELENYFFEE